MELPQFTVFSAIQFERDSIGSPKKRNINLLSHGATHGPNEIVSTYSNQVEGNNTSYRMNIIDVLMEMEARVNEEMFARHRGSIASSTSSSAINSSFSNVCRGSSSAFTQTSRPYTIEELNEISRTTLLLMVNFNYSIFLPSVMLAGLLPVPHNTVNFSFLLSDE